MWKMQARSSERIVQNISPKYFFLAFVPIILQNNEILVLSRVFCLCKFVFKDNMLKDIRFRDFLKCFDLVKMLFLTHTWPKRL